MGCPFSGIATRPSVIWDSCLAKWIMARCHNGRETPTAFAFSSLMISTAEAPSVICDEFPAVTFPSSLKAGFSLASLSMRLSGRMPSSDVKLSSVS